MISHQLDEIYQEMRGHLTADRIEEAREVLVSALTKELPIACLLALLTTTRGRKEFAQERRALARVVKERDPERCERLLKGLIEKEEL